MPNSPSNRPAGFSDAEMAVGRLMLDSTFRTAFFNCGGDVGALRTFATGHGLNLSDAELTEAASLDEVAFTDGMAAILGHSGPTGTV